MNVKTKTIIYYLLGTFGLSYLLWGGMILCNNKGILQFGKPLGMCAFIIGALSPTIVSIFVLKINREVESIKKIIKDSFSFKQNIVVYLLIILFLAVPYAVNSFSINLIITNPLYLIVLLLPLMMLGGGFEEVGWRYIFQPYLEKRLPFPIATLVVAAVWTLWHLPLFFIAGTPQNLYMSFGVFAIDVVGLSFALGIICHRCSGVFPCILFHSLNNSLNSTISIPENIRNSIISTGIIIFLACTIYVAERRLMFFLNKSNK